MIFNPIAIDGAWLIDLEPRRDERGSFSRAFCEREHTEHGLEGKFVQANLSKTHRRGTIRGLHYQLPPAEEAKLVRCIRGAVFDVLVDLRPGSPTFRSWQGVELTADNDRQLYVPKGCAHGYQTLADDTELYYLASAFYSPQHERGIRWDDPAFGIQWAITENVELSPKDLNWPDYALTPRTHETEPAGQEVR